MKKGKQPKSNLKVTGISTYIKNRQLRKDTPVIFSRSGTYYFFEDKMIEEKVFLKMFPLNLIPVNYKGENPDRTKVK